MNKKFSTWFISGFIMSISLFFYSSSYWGNHGFGDSSRIPIGYGQVIQNVDYHTFFEAGVYQQETIDAYSIMNKHICAKQNDSSYFTYNLENSELIKFASPQQYENYAGKKSLAKVEELKDFSYHYKNYWNGWRFILLP